MLSFLLAVHFLLAILIIGLVLLQKHDADGVLGTGGSGGTGKMFSVRGQANLLTRSTAVLMTFFFINCLVMAKMVKHTPHKESIIDRVAKESAPASTNRASDSAGGGADNAANGTANNLETSQTTPAKPSDTATTTGQAAGTQKSDGKTAKHKTSAPKRPAKVPSKAK